MAPEDKKPNIVPESRFPSLYVDNLHIDNREDGMHLIRFFTTLPEGWSEQARLMVSDLHLRRMLEVLTSNCKSWESSGDEPSLPVDEG